MELNEYQQKAMETCMPSSENFAYMLTNLVGEVGEFASKVAKAIRKEQLSIKGNELQTTICTSDKDIECREALIDELKLELGDCLWQVSGLCAVLGWSLEDVAEANLNKLASRKQRDVIDGEGDHR